MGVQGGYIGSTGVTFLGDPGGPWGSGVILFSFAKFLFTTSLIVTKIIEVVSTEHDFA